MPAPATVPEFLELVRKSGLVPGSKLDELLGRHQATGTPQTIDQTAGVLVRDALLTLFQAKQIKIGRYKRFTIGTKYRLLELIGAGGMGAVYLCEHTLMRRLVALKVLPQEKLDDQSNLERFYREARAVAALDHPNIVRAYDIDQYDKLHFLVMEYVDGHSLQEIVARYAMEKRHFDPVRAAHYIAQAAVGMQHAHELGMVHRDIKPGNLLLDRSGVIKVLDMGLARFFNKQQDSVTEKYDEKCVLGTADYLAPEQAVTNVVDVRADIYSLGGTLYFMLTGQTPFPDGTIAAKLVAHQTREPQVVEMFRSDVPEGLLAVLRKMMAKAPDDRYQQPIEVAEALAEWTEQPVPPPPEREMPVLCPLVQELLGPATDRTGGQPSLARMLFAPGRGVFTRGAGSSTNVRARADSADANATSSNAAFPLPRAVPHAGPEPSAPRSARGSTVRASAATTAPLSPPAGTPKPRPKSAPPPAPPAPIRAPFPLVSRRLVWLLVGGGVVLAGLFIIGAVVAYQIGKGTGRATTTPSNPGSGAPAPDVPGPGDLVPGSGDLIITPAQAAPRVGQVQTVEFTVESAQATGGALTLNSQPDRGAAHFAVRIAPGYFAQSGDLDQVRENLTGKTIRARGKITPNPDGGFFLDVRVPKQIVIVADP